MKRFTRPQFRLALTSTIVFSMLAGCSTPSYYKEELDGNPDRVPQSEGYPGPAGGLNKSQNQSLYAKYCVGKADSATVPKVNYKNPDVQEAAKKLSVVVPLSFYMGYGGVDTLYGVKKGGKYVNAPAEAPEGTTPHAHAFLTILCGQFRDRATQIQAKVNWVRNLYLLPTEKQGPIDPKKNLWSQVSAHSYRPYLAFSRALHNAKAQARNPKTISFGGEYKHVDTVVDGTRVCEMKYLFSEYIAKGRTFDNLASFRKGEKEYEKANCTKDEIEDYYDFRGDSNFKPYTPEGNGMLWTVRDIAGRCASLTKARPKGSNPESVALSNSECSDYFRRPFWYRYNAARAAVASWLMYDYSLESLFGEAGQLTVMEPNLNGAKGPWSFREGANGQSQLKLVKEFLDKKDVYWMRPDMGFNDIFKLGPNGEEAYKRLRAAVNRHTDWYSSGYVNPAKGEVATQAYSPFVATSYEMGESDGFAQPGLTVNSPSDGRKHWMFVFRVKKDNWYTTDRLRKGDKIDFDKMWIDETSFGDNGLADKERAWDKLGTASDDEFDSILYLHNLDTSGYVVEE